MTCVSLGPGREPARRDRLYRTGRRDRPVVQLPSIALRIAVMAGIVVVVFGVILFRLWFLQILSGQQFLAKANDNRLTSVRIIAPRGAIKDRNGMVIVDNRAGLAVGIRPMDVPKGELGLVTHRLAAVLKMPATKLDAQLEDHTGLSFRQLDRQTGPGGYDLIVVKDDVPIKVVAYIREHTFSFPGVEIQANYLRSYPKKDLAAHLLGNVGEIDKAELKLPRFKGYTAGDMIGKGGAEWTYDRYLRGVDGVARLEVDAFLRPKTHTPIGGRLPQPGDNLLLTIDAKVQSKAEQALRYGISLAHSSGANSANGGAAVVMDVKTGQILAMASYPTYDPKVWVGGISPKDYARLNAKKANQPLFDRAMQGQYAVGSTFKPVDAIAGLEEGVISPSTTFFCPGWFKVPIANDKSVWHCWLTSGHGTVDLVQALAQSCDVYFYNVGYLFYGRKGTELEDWAMRLGMGKPTGIDLPGEAAGLVPTPAWVKKVGKTAVDRIWTPGRSVNLAIGQGDLQATPLQLATAYAAIANGGYLVQPHVGLKVVNAQGQLVKDLQPAGRRNLDINPADLDVVRQGLREAATVGTSAPIFGGYPVAVAGKTGTAQVFGKSDYAWYASYAPANDPKYVVVVMIEQGGHGGTAAAPAARLIYDQLFGVKGQTVTGAVRGD